jgi:DNA-binding LacI/PurR family transcriptional regulator
MTPPHPRRPTIVDVAAKAGVSKMAVSLAVNGRPGLSDDTRRRVLEVAEELGWRPNPTARSLSGGAVGAVGLVLRRPADTLTSDTFYMQLFTGIETELSATGTSLVLHVPGDIDAERVIYRRLAAERRVDAVLLTDLEADDARPALARELGLPAVALGGPVAGVPYLHSDDAGSTDLVLDHLHELGHRTVARIGGPARWSYAAQRDTAFLAGADRRGMRGIVAPGEPTPSTAAAATLRLIDEDAPTAVVYDTDAAALAGIAAARSRGLRVPTDLSVVAWDGSVLGAFSDPPLTILKRDVVELGRGAARALLAAASTDGLPAGPVVDGHDLSEPRLTVGGSTAEAPATLPI